jgi:IS1 family transposase
MPLLQGFFVVPSQTHLTMPNRSSIMVSMNRLSPAKRAAVIAALVEGNSIRATVRMTSVAKNTVTKLLVDMGTVCSLHQDLLMRELPCERLQIDEIWAFCYAKERNVPRDKRGQYGYGDVWTWVALDADTKLVPSYLVGPRDLGSAVALIDDLAPRLTKRVQLTTDGHRPYITAVERAFKGEIDYATLTKLYGTDPLEPDHRYSPPICTSITGKIITGDPDPEHISTSYIERQNLTMRMSMRRFTRLTNAFSKKVENLTAAVSLHFAHYNLCRIHQTLGTTPAVAAGLTDQVWKVSELIAWLADAERVPVKRGSYAKTRALRAANSK